jgi:N-acyl-D-aspartate/D-glutamate deacylase
VYDIVIRGGQVIDGSGGPAVIADVGINGRRIAAVGPELGEGRVVIHAESRVVTPGFVDVHTHLDAQLFWDPVATPSCFHGVTTVVLGNCGFGVAPFSTGTQEYVLKTLELVEEIPFGVTINAVPFSWNTFGEYLDSLDDLDLGVNVAAFVPHSALRHSIMGARCSLDVASADETSRMASAVEKAMNQGAAGFASSKGPNQFDATGQPIPSRLADDAEMRSLVRVCAGRPWQINMRTKMVNDAAAMIAEVEQYAEWTREAGARLTWTPFLVQREGSAWRSVLEHNRRLPETGAEVVPQVTPVPMTVAAQFNGPTPTVATRDWKAALGDDFWSVPINERVARIRQRSIRKDIARLSTSANVNLPSVSEWVVAHSPSLPNASGKPIGSLEGTTGIDTLLDLLIEDQLETLLQVPVLNADEEAVAELISDDGTMIGIGDAGAHVQTISSYIYPTYLLTVFVREKRQMTLEDAVRRLTSRPAEFIGFADRGYLRPGYAADVCVIDFEHLRLEGSEMRHDLPSGAPRLYQRPRGFDAVIVNGAPVVQDDRLTDRRAGTLVRM